MQNYGIRLKQARLQIGLTQVELAEKLGLSQTSYQRMETGAHDIKMSNIYNICKTLGISADWLLGIDREDDTTVLNQANQMRNEVYKACKALQKGGLSESDKQAIIDQLQALIDQLSK